jgi:hypothetical protein
MFQPGVKDRAQPNQFFAGLNKGVFTVAYEPNLQWLLPAKNVLVLPTAQNCTCPTTNNVTTKTEILELSKEFLATGFQAADLLQKETKSGLPKLSKTERARLRELMERAKGRSVRTFAQIQHTLTSSIQDTSINCPTPQIGCATVDDGPLLNSIRNRYYLALNSIRRIAARASFLESGQTLKYRALVTRGTALSKQALDALNKVQRFRTVCSESSTLQSPAQASAVAAKKRRK